jgi:hypothetical protein
MMADVWDFYQQCEDGLATRLRALNPSFFKQDKQVSDDDSVLSEGADYWIIYRPGAFPIPDNLLTQKIMEVDWNVTMDMYVRYKTYKESWGKFRKFRAAVFFLLHSDQTLGDTLNVHRVTFSSNEIAQYFRFANSSEEAKPNFIIQTCNVVIRQRVRFDKTVFNL